jgi:hypothetical protein
MNFRLSLAGRGVNTIRLFVMVCFIFGIVSLIHTCTTTQQPPTAKSFTTEHRASASTIASPENKWCLRRASLGACSRHASRSLRISSSITFQPLLGQAARALSPTA